MVRPVKVGLLGLGTVGSGVVRILNRHAERLAARAGRTLQIERVVVRDRARDRQCNLPQSMLETRADSILEDPQIEIVVELVGGVDPTCGWLESALRAGKDVVTANKALLAERGHLLFPLARLLGRVIACEGAIAGGIPVIATVRQSLTANEIQSICAVLNGTSNFIVCQLESGHSNGPQALAKAQALGIAESDPTLDLDGTDAAQKLAILAQLAFECEIDWRAIPRRGIEGIQPADFEYARKANRRIRPLACAVRVHPGSTEIDLFVAPTLVPEASPLALTFGAENAVLLHADGIGRLLLQGLGAGQMPTASAVVSDIVDIVAGRGRIAEERSPLWPGTLPQWKADPNRGPMPHIASYPRRAAEEPT